MFTLCTTAESVSLALENLLDAEYVFLDCEGRDLGCAPGALSLISIGSPHAAEVYLFDVLALPRDSLQLLFYSIFSLTSSARAKTKVVWDGRMDYVELFYSYSCPIENVLDLQLVDVISRTKRGETEHKRLCRFVRKTFSMSEVRKLQLEEVYVLNGMDGAMREHKIDGVEMKNESVKKLHTDNLSEIWMQRPLSDQLLDYAASDIKRIAKLYDHFVEHGYLKQREQLLDLSSCYVSMHYKTGKPDPENIYLRGPFLPLSVSLEINSTDDVRAPASSKECSGCGRTIPERHFPYELTTKNKGKKTPSGKMDENVAPRASLCKICTLIVKKMRCAEKLKIEMEKKAQRTAARAEAVIKDNIN
ncbi:hypothetical protein ACEPAI_2423 [Sanghuangporus weigelae]